MIFLNNFDLSEFTNNKFKDAYIEYKLENSKDLQKDIIEAIECSPIMIKGLKDSILKQDIADLKENSSNISLSINEDKYTITFSVENENKVLTFNDNLVTYLDNYGNNVSLIINNDLVKPEGDFVTHVHNLEHHEATEATCEYEGNIEY